MKNYGLVSVCAYGESKEENRNFECQSDEVTHTDTNASTLASAARPFVIHDIQFTHQYDVFTFQCLFLTRCKLFVATWNNFLFQLKNVHFRIFPLKSVLFAHFIALARQRRKLQLSSHRCHRKLYFFFFFLFCCSPHLASDNWPILFSHQELWAFAMLMYPLDQHNDANRGKCHIKFRRIIIIVERIQFKNFLSHFLFVRNFAFWRRSKRKNETEKEKESASTEKESVHHDHYDHSELLLAIFRCLSFRFILLSCHFSVAPITLAALTHSPSLDSKHSFLCAYYTIIFPTEKSSEWNFHGHIQVGL